MEISEPWLAEGEADGGRQRLSLRKREAEASKHDCRCEVQLVWGWLTWFSCSDWSTTQSLLKFGQIFLISSKSWRKSSAPLPPACLHLQSSVRPFQFHPLSLLPSHSSLRHPVSSTAGCYPASAPKWPQPVVGGQSKFWVFRIFREIWTLDYINRFSPSSTTFDRTSSSKSFTFPSLFSLLQLHLPNRTEDTRRPPPGQG